MTLTMRNDGVGVPDGLDIATVDSLGLGLVTSLVLQLSGTLEVKRDGGSTLINRFPA
jgi:two-component sensor histidine kinase